MYIYIYIYINTYIYIYIDIKEREGKLIKMHCFITYFNTTLRYLFRKNVSNLQFFEIKFIYDISFIIDS